MYWVIKIYCTVAVLCLATIVTATLPDVVDRILTSTDTSSLDDTAIANSTDISSHTSTDRMRCKYTMDVSLLEKNATLQKYCCSRMITIFQIYWNHSTMKLGDYLRALKMWKCKRFQEECDNRYYAFTQYTSLLYDRFCSADRFEYHCTSRVLPFVQTEILQEHRDSSQVHGSGGDFIEGEYTLTNGWSDKLNSEVLLRNMSREDQMEPCVQAALVNIRNFSVGRYFEAKQSEMAFCSIAWCAFTTDVFATDHVTDSMCMSST